MKKWSSNKCAGLRGTSGHVGDDMWRGSQAAQQLSEVSCDAAACV